MNRVELGECRETMARLANEGVKVQMCVTSPPYYGLRNYLPDMVQIKPNLSAEDMEFLMGELARLNIAPYEPEQ